ncbi:hypothetical protein QMM58_13360 [Clostridioides difficile]|nr:hypothetical protein [Clostridioides difficile]
MAKYKDFKSYMQANYIEQIKDEIESFVDNSHDGLGFHSLNVLSVCDQKVDKVEIKTMMCHDDLGPMIRMDIHCAADIITKNLGTGNGVAKKERRWFTAYATAYLANGLHDFVVFKVDEYSPGQFDKEDALDEYLVPYIYSDQLESEADSFYQFYCDGAIFTDGWRLPIEYILDGMGIEYFEAPLPNNEFGRMYFNPSTEEIYQYDPYMIQRFKGKKEKHLVKKEIKAGTMLISVDNHFMDEVGSTLNTIAHEIIHWEKHQKFFEILSLLDDDETSLSCAVSPEVSPSHLEGVKKAIWWAEWQANALAPRILMPRMIFTELFEQIYNEQSQTPYFHSAEIMERTLDKLGACFGVSKYAAKLRALQLGYKCAEGALLVVDGHYQTPYTFNPEALGDHQTFILDRGNYEKNYKSNAKFARLIDSGKFLYVGCVVCINDPLYVRPARDYEPGDFALTDYALENVDECCLKFKRNFETVKSSGDFYNQCYLSNDVNAVAFCESKTIEYEDNQDVIEQEEELDKIDDEIDRVLDIYEKLPRAFHLTLDTHMERLKKSGKVTNLELECRTGITERYIRQMRKEKTNVSSEYVYAICIGLHLHPLFSDDLVEKACGGYSTDKAGMFAKYLIHHHFHESLKLVNKKLAMKNYPLWGVDEKIVS